MDKIPKNSKSTKDTYYAALNEVDLIMPIDKLAAMSNKALSTGDCI